MAESSKETKTAGLRYHSIYGILDFAVRDPTVDELPQQVPLVRFNRLALLHVRDVLAAR